MKIYMVEDIVGFRYYIMAKEKAIAWTKWARYLSYIAGYTVSMVDVQNTTATLIELDESVITGVYKA